MNNVLQFLEESAVRYPAKTAVQDGNGECTYKELMEDGKAIGSYLAERTRPRRPVAVFMDKGVFTLKCFMGIVYAGCFYTLIDSSFPIERISKILNVLDTDIVITQRGNENKLREAGYEGMIAFEDELVCGDKENCIKADAGLLCQVRSCMIDTDPLYCNFTSGSTGTPKGVLISHRSVIDFIDNFTEIFDITADDVIGNQAPFDFDVSVKDIYSSLKMGATLVIIPRSYFMFPNSVVDMLEEKKVTTLIWAVSALCLLNRLHGLKYKTPANINKILFSGEQMPVKQLNQWRSHYPNAMFVNLYGPTEITCNCTYYILDREFSEDEKLPMGKAFPNERVFLLDDKDNEVTCDRTDTPAEICVSGTALALGYYNNPGTTSKVFTDNPLNKAYYETIYKTGDLAYWGKDGNLYFAGRKDFQIKHMGHRIELEEIESALGNVSVVERACCFFDEDKNKVVAYYIGMDDRKKIIQEMKIKVPEYMIPNVFRCVEELPMNKNGKTDRNLLREMYRKG